MPLGDLLSRQPGHGEAEAPKKPGVLDGEEVRDVGAEDVLEDRLDEIVRPPVVTDLAAVKPRVASPQPVAFERLREPRADGRRERRESLPPLVERAVEDRREPDGRRERPGELRLPALQHLAEREDRELRRERAPGETLPAPARDQDARGARQDHPEGKRVTGVLDLVLPAAELVHLVEEDVGRGFVVERPASDLGREPPEDPAQRRRLLAQQLEVEPDEEDVRSARAAPQELLDDLVQPGRLSHLAWSADDLDEASRLGQPCREVEDRPPAKPRRRRAYDGRVAPPGVQLAEDLDRFLPKRLRRGHVTNNTPMFYV